jgi:hypothetical protein
MITKRGAWDAVMGETYDDLVKQLSYEDAMQLQAFYSQLLHEWHRLNHEVELTYAALDEAQVLDEPADVIRQVLAGKPDWLTESILDLIYGGDHSDILWQQVKPKADE